MPARDEHRRWNVTSLELQAWRNFSRRTEMHFGGRAFFIGPNASGKSNVLDALRFLRDVAGEGLQGAVARRGGVSENQSFRVLARFFESIRYLHIVPHVVWEYRRDGDFRDDPFGSDFLERIAITNKRSRESRLRKIQEALRAAVPQFERLDLERDLTGGWHLYSDYKHWRPKAARQNESTFSDGTLRLLGLLWSLAEPGGPLLLEEPELSLHDALVSRLAGLMARMNRTTGRQVLVTTHSVALLRDSGIDLNEIHLLDPGEKVPSCEAPLSWTTWRR